MALVRHLSKAPITEAIVDIRVKAHPEFNAQLFEQLKDPLAKRFPHVSKQQGIEASFTIDRERGAIPSTRDLGLRGYFYKSEDGLDIAQFRVDGFTYNRLKPYTSWERIFPQAMDLWKLYATTAKPTHVTRLALRYLNQIVVPKAVDAFEQIVTAPLPLPPEIPSLMSRFFTRVTVHDQETGLTAHISQAFEPNERGEPGTLILDIEVFHQRDYDAGSATTFDAISKIFSSIHEMKNKIFFQSLTEETIARYE